MNDAVRPNSPEISTVLYPYPNIKFIVSGSAAAALKFKSQESGAGRFTDFILPPLTFQEFLLLTNKEHLIEEDDVQGNPATNNLELLNKQFIDYLNYGGYPELYLIQDQRDPTRYIRHDIIDKVLLRDLPSLYGIQDVQELNALFTFIAFNSGSEVSLGSLSRIPVCTSSRSNAT